MEKKHNSCIAKLSAGLIRRVQIPPCPPLLKGGMERFIFDKGGIFGDSSLSLRMTIENECRTTAIMYQCACAFADSFSSGASPTRALVVRRRAAMLAPFCRAAFTTFVGSIMPAFIMSVYFPDAAS